MQATQTVSISVPVGHIMANSRWSNSIIVTDLQGSIPVHFDDSTSAIDFHPSSNVGVVFFSEADLVEGVAYKRRAARLRKTKIRGVVVVEKTSISEQYFLDVQKFCVGNLGLDLIPVRDQSEAAAFLVQLVYAEGKLGSNPFKKAAARQPVEPAVVTAVTSCKGVGQTSALALLEKYPSLEKICQASLEDISTVIGRASAGKLYQFLHGVD